MSSLRYLSSLKTNCQNSWAILAIEETAGGKLYILHVASYPTKELAQQYIDQLQRAGLPNSSSLGVYGPEATLVSNFTCEIPHPRTDALNKESLRIFPVVSNDVQEQKINLVKPSPPTTPLPCSSPASVSRI